MTTATNYNSGTQELRIEQYSDNINVSVITLESGRKLITLVSTSQRGSEYESTTVTQITEREDVIALIKLLSDTL